MDLDELQSVQSRERQTDSLQQLRPTFYQDAAEYIGRLEDERDRAAERADDPWNSPEVSRLNDDIDTAEGTVEAIYERRVGKIVKMASLAAADMPTDDDGLTEEERTLFETLVGAIENNRDQVFAILDGDAPVSDAGAPAGPGSPVDAGPARDTPPSSDQPTGLREDTPARAADTPEVDDGHRAADAHGAGNHATPGSGDTRSHAETRVDAADVMGGSGDPASESPETAPTDREPRTDAPDPDPGGGQPPTGNTAEADGPDHPTPDGGTTAPAVDRSTVKITSDVGEIFGVDERAYDLTAEDVVTLPEPNAGPLVERGAAERLD